MIVRLNLREQKGPQAVARLSGVLEGEILHKQFSLFFNTTSIIVYAKFIFSMQNSSFVMQNSYHLNFLRHQALRR